MSSYCVNPTFPGSLPNGQDSFLGQIPLYPAGYDALRHFPASYGATSLQDKTYTSPCFYQQSNTVIACNRASYEYGASCFYSDKDISSASLSGSGKQRGHGDYLHFSPEQHYKSDSVQTKILNEEGSDRKYTSPVYPWMQRMNSCAAVLKGILLEKVCEDAKDFPGKKNVVMCKDTASWLSAKKMYTVLVENQPRTAKYHMADYHHLRTPVHRKRRVTER
ncbi:homeobox protein Hox-A6 isoform X2 [Emydura macquarii macquarii]|uniref:homeobox protein Hox-A6 isoform X2 n=1 Tax=Emydura macquarii macquarii TaxID=1129001 RepID=UPI00352B0BB1